MEKISRYPVPEMNELPEDVKQIWEGAQERFGFVPNVAKALSHRPAELRAFLAYDAALTEKESGLTPADTEMLIVAHSNHNGCMYCVASHGAALRMASGDPKLSEQVAVNYREADITPRQKAMIAFAMKVTDDSRSINEEDFAALREHGFSNEDIWDIAGLTAFYNMSNRMMSFLAVRPDDEFYKMGR
ncbi:peroxidase-related enzyme [Vibrio sp. JC009]|uniref:peroxidase-related enzyme n=1 Tax=Vibrio sp. JC009 TaxID=2912314 RepID=UPI0023B0EA4B|nr:peroxidase-related enzyme [Vibrio sp. JC009]WED24332.1 peroxidase-related enzyme [Vibrio sp. JC009]